MHDCMVCGGKTRPYFEKDFAGVCGLGKVQYAVCDRCGFAFSDTHFSLNGEEWGRINELFHMSFFGTDECPDDPRWMQRLAAQRAAIGYLASHGVFDLSLPAYDYGCGDGKLVDMLKTDGLAISKYDKYLHNTGPEYLRDEEIRPGKFGLVMNTSVFEHVRDLATLDEIAASVHPQRGVFALHTLVCEKVPQDPAWFYLLPVHVSLFSNRSMEILVERWKFAASIYDLEARMWFLFRDEAAARSAYEIARAGRPEVHFKRGFVDYWK